jgi:sugar O-acyltransferase (sialic acid O-acetyltransferase NeuD family)
LRSLVIVGAGGHGREVLDVVEAINAIEPTYNVLGFLADHRGAHEPIARRAVKILGPTSLIDSLDADYVVAIGDPVARKAIDEQFMLKGLSAPVLIHPAATVGSDVHLSPGSVVMAGARITTNLVAGRHLQVNVNATISHDCRLGDYVTLSPGCSLSGNVELGDGVYLGTGSVVIPGVRIGANTMVGAGAVVIRDLPADVTAVGIPAKPLQAKSRTEVR